MQKEDASTGVFAKAADGSITPLQALIAEALERNPESGLRCASARRPARGSHPLERWMIRCWKRESSMRPWLRQPSTGKT
jgi:hypothetical protein